MFFLIRVIFGLPFPGDGLLTDFTTFGRGLGIKMQGFPQKNLARYNIFGYNVGNRLLGREGEEKCGK